MLLSGNKLQTPHCPPLQRQQTRRTAVHRRISCSANGAPKKTTVHRLIDQQGALLVPGVHDALSAKVLAHTGHVSAFVSGYAVSVACHGFRYVATCWALLKAYRTQHDVLSNACFAQASNSSRCARQFKYDLYAVRAYLQVSATLLGEPDVGLLTPPEMARKTSQICMSIPQIPVIVDADTGKRSCSSPICVSDGAV